MTNRQKIRKYIEQNSPVSKRELMVKFLYEANPDTISRTCRQMVADGDIEKVVGAEYTTYKTTGKLF